METGTDSKDDVTWIKHECAEQHYELKYASGYKEAHDLAQTRFDGAPWENQFNNIDLIYLIKTQKIQFYKKDNIYRIIRYTGAQDNILGVAFDTRNKSDNNIEVIEWDFPNLYKSGIKTSKEEVLKQVLSGLESVNQSLGTNYKLSQIYFTPFNSGANSVYHVLICKLIRHYHSGNEFTEF